MCYPSVIYCSTPTLNMVFTYSVFIKHLPLRLHARQYAYGIYLLTHDKLVWPDGAILRMGHFSILHNRTPLQRSHFQIECSFSRL